MLGDGYTDDPQMIAAAEVAGRDAAEHLVMKELWDSTNKQLLNIGSECPYSGGF